jgi:ABC-type branched-subunit amino acid transport system ATPase component
MQSGLSVTNLSVAYGESQALFDVSIDVGTSEVVSIVGRNGAGKTTLLRTIAGFLKPSAGTIVADSTPLADLPPYIIARLGIKYVPQDKKVFGDLTVRENLELGSYATGDYDWGPVIEYFPKLRELMDRKAGYLSGGERQMLMLGRAILGAPRLLLVDEPTEGLAPSIVAHLKDVFSDLRKKMALVMVEQNLPLVCAIADRIYALNEGSIVHEIHERGEIRPEVCEPYL